LIEKDCIFKFNKQTCLSTKNYYFLNTNQREKELKKINKNKYALSYFTIVPPTREKYNLPHFLSKEL
jgi:hypothetical protein